MRILFVHKGFPGQFRHLVKRLVDRGDQVWSILPHQSRTTVPPGVRAVPYRPSRGLTPGLQESVREFEAKVLRAEAVAERADQLRLQGLIPDLIVGHPGWGEMLYLASVWPNAPQLHYLEFFYGVAGTDCDFNDRYAPTMDRHMRSSLISKNASALLNLRQMSWGLTPTHFQCSLFPSWTQQQTSIIHDGIDTNWLTPDQHARLDLPNGVVLKAGDEVVTFVNRTFEPYRGVHVVVEALVDLQRMRPNVQAILIGKDSPRVSYGQSRSDGQGWLSFLRAEFGDQLDWSRIHCPGRVSHAVLRQVYRVSAAHVYFTYPFVLSWSLLEAMSCGCLVVGSDVAPVAEVIQHGVNGLLLPFSCSDTLSAQLATLLGHPERAAALKQHARRSIVNRFHLDRCLKQQVSLLDTLAT